MRKSKIRYFLGSNSSEGFASLYDDLTDPKRGEGRLIIKAGPGGGKSSFMKRIAAAMDSAGTSVEYIYCSGDPDSLDGIFIPALSLAVMDGTAPHAAEPVCYGALDQYIDLFRFCDRQALRTKAGEIMRISREYKSHYKNAYSYISSACSIYNAAVHHDNEHDRAAAHTILDAYLPQIKGSSGRIRRRFTSAFTYKGSIDFTLDSCDGLSEVIRTEYGPEFISELSSEASLRGYDCILGKDPLIPKCDSIVVFPQLGIGFACSSKEKELRAVDRVLYVSTLNQARHELQYAKKLHDELENVYIKAVNFNELNEFTQQKINELTAQLKQKKITF